METPSANRQIVAECWTCFARYNAAKHRYCKADGVALRALTEYQAARHQAQGHDVRPIGVAECDCASYPHTRACTYRKAVVRAAGHDVRPVKVIK